MKFDDLYPGEYIQASDLKEQDRTLKIARVRGEILEGIKGPKLKCIITFEGAKKEFVANRTNGEALKLMFGVETDNWITKRVTLYPTTTEVGGETLECIRVRGSPDITAPMDALIKRGKKKLKIHVIPTGQKQATGKPPPAAAGNGSGSSPPPAPRTPPPAESSDPLDDTLAEPGADG